MFISPDAFVTIEELLAQITPDCIVEIDDSDPKVYEWIQHDIRHMTYDGDYNGHYYGCMYCGPFPEEDLAFKTDKRERRKRKDFRNNRLEALDSHHNFRRHNFRRRKLKNEPIRIKQRLGIIRKYHLNVA